MSIKISSGPLTLFLVFLILRLTQVIDWSWWWITTPLWIPIAIYAIIAIVIVGFTALVDVYDKRKS